MKNSSQLEVNLPMPRDAQSLVVGHSHISAISLAAKECKLDVKSWQLRSKDLDAQLVEIEYRDGNAFLNDSFAKYVGQVPASVNIFLSIGGNDHNVMGLLESEPPFRFYNKSTSYLDNDVCNNMVYLPRGAVKASLTKTLQRRTLDVYSAFRNALPSRKLYWLSPPPPISNEKHIRQWPGYFKDLLEKRKLATFDLRYSLWSLQKEIVMEHNNRLDITCVGHPEGCQDPDGGLSEKYRQKDPTHGNREYGALVIDQIASF